MGTRFTDVLGGAHGDLDASGASQAIGSCWQQSSSAAAGGITAGIGHHG